MDNKTVITISPHIRAEHTITTVMRDVIIALMPAAAAAVYFYSFRALLLITVCVVSCCGTEYAARRIMQRDATLFDLSAVLTGILLAFCLPPTLPLWMAVIGSVFAVALGKQIFGGLGHNPFNPALIGRAFLQISWPREMNGWVNPFDGITAASPLSIQKLGLDGTLPDTMTMFLGNIPGCLGETSKVMLILGVLYLVARQRIKLPIPVFYLATVVVFSLIAGVNPLFHLCAGGLVLGALYMATDPVTSPVSLKGMIMFGIGCGFLTMLIRLKGGFPEGVCYSILIMNMLTPFIDRITTTRRFGA